MDALNSKASLSQSDAESLKKFSEQFKTYLESQQNEKGVVDSEVSQIKTEQKTINYDISRVEDHALRVEKKQKEQDITKRRDMLSKHVIERLTETLKENEPEKVFSAKFVEEKIEGCFGDSELQRVYNLFYAGIKDYG